MFSNSKVGKVSVHCRLSLVHLGLFRTFPYCNRMRLYSIYVVELLYSRLIYKCLVTVLLYTSIILAWYRSFCIDVVPEMEDSDNSNRIIPGSVVKVSVPANNFLRDKNKLYDHLVVYLYTCY